MNIAILLVVMGLGCIALSLLAGQAIHRGMNDEH